MKGSGTRESRPWIASLGLAALGLFLLALCIRQISAVDVWWQLATGRWIVEQQALPEFDVFSQLAGRREWIELRWLYCVFAYWAFELGGPALLILLKTAVVAATASILAWDSRRALVEPLGLSAMALGLAAASDRLVVRPELVTFVMLAVVLVALARLRRGPSRVLLVLLPALMVLWVNSHTLFVLGPVAAWGFVAADGLERLLGRWRPSLFITQAGGAPRAIVNGRLLSTAGLMTAACLLNPYGLRGALFPVTLFLEIQPGGVLADAIIEFRSPFQIATWPSFLWASAALALLTAATFVMNRRRLDLPRLLLGIAFLYLACVSIRNVALFAFVAIWCTLANLADRERATDSPSASRWKRPTRLAHASVALLLVGTSWYLATDRHAVRERTGRPMGWGVAPAERPIGAVQLMLDYETRGELFNELPDGSYLAWAAAGRLPVFVDPRLEVYGEEFLGSYFAISGRRWSDLGAWERFTAQNGIQTALLMHRYDVNLMNLLVHSRTWRLVHVDARGALFVRDIAQHAELIRDHEIDLTEPWTGGGPVPEERPSAWRRRLGAVGLPWYSFEMAKFFLRVGSPHDAVPHLERGLERFPDHVEMRWTLSQVYLSQGRTEEAAELMSGLELSPLARQRADTLLTDLLLQQGRTADAIAPLERLARSQPSNAGTWDKLGRAQFQAGDITAAIRSFSRLTELRSSDPEAWSNLGLARERGGDLVAASEAYERSLRLDGNNPVVHNQLALLLARRGDLAAARRHLEQALAIRPDYASARSNLQRLDAIRSGSSPPAGEHR